jgi:hypothetical protein
MHMIGCVISGLFGFLHFGLLDTKVPNLIFLAVALGLPPIMYGPQAAPIAESFSPRLRYSGTSLGYQLASIIVGGPSPFIATALFATFASSLPIGPLEPRLRGERPRRCVAVDRLHEPGRLAEIRRRGGRLKLALRGDGATRPSRQTRWWRGESGANPSRNPEFPASWEYTGNFIDSKAQPHTNRREKATKSGSYEPIPCAF